MHDSGPSSCRESPPSISPSLARCGRGARAFEIKFVLDEGLAADVAGMMSRWLAPDPHADPVTGSYDITSIYCDTPGWDVYYREGAHAYRKFRVRRYGTDGPVFLERKSVRKSVVRKRRSAAVLTNLESVNLDEAPAEAGWFVRQVEAAGLRPVCRIAYQRQALSGSCGEGPMRVTFDRRVRGLLLTHWSFNGLATPRALLENVVVCEFKFRDAMPGPMKEVVGALGLVPRRVSKYRACIDAFAETLGVKPGAGNA